MDSNNPGFILFLVLVFVWFLARSLYRLWGTDRWIDIVEALRQCDSKTFDDLGAPTFFFLQFGRKKAFANERLWFEVLRNPGRFQAHPRISEAAKSYRRFAILNLFFWGSFLTAFLVLLAKK